MVTKFTGLTIEIYLIAIIRQLIPYNTNYPTSPFIMLDPGFQTDSLTLGPEIMTNISGFYDYKTNGEVNHFVQVYSSDPMQINAIDYQADTSDPTGATSRRTYYTFSTDGGMTWAVPVEVPTIRSGFCVLRLKSTGEAVICNHNEAEAGVLNSNLYVELAPQVGVFTEYINNEPRGIWPQISVLSNGNVGILSRPNNSGVPTDYDTVFFNTFNGTNFSPRQALYVAHPPYYGSVGSNERHNLATNGSGEVTAVFAPTLEDDTLTNSKVYYRTSTDNGSTWGSLQTLFSPYTINGGNDTVSTAGGSDLVYKPGTNKWYYAYPITVDNLYANGKLVITRSNGLTDTITTAAEVGATTTYICI